MKKKVIASSLMTVLMAGSLMVGASYALFTSESSTDLTVTSGKIDVRASIDNLRVSSMDVPMPGTQFALGGQAILEENKLTLDRIMPGDEVSFDFTIKNYSNVKAKYRCALNCITGYKLFDELSIDFTSDTQWTTLLPEADPTNPEGVTTTATISLSKYAGNEYQDLKTEMAIVVEAVQGNATVSDTISDKTLSPDDGVKQVPAENTEPVKVETSTGSMEVNVPADRVDPAVGEVGVSVAPTRSTQVLKEAVPADSAAVYYDIDVTGLKEGTEPVKVELYLGRGYEDVDVLHDHNGVLEEPTSVRYSKDSGFVSFKTASFSPFAIVASRQASISDQVSPIENNKMLQKAFDESKVVTLTEDIVLAAHGDNIDTLNPIININHDVKFNLNGHKVSLAPCEEFAGNKTTSVMFAINTASRLDVYGNGTLDAELGANNSYIFNVNNVDADLFIEDGTYYGALSAVQVQKGYCKINGGHFELAKTCKEVAPQYAKYLANCIDASYGSGEAILYIDGGEFVNQNPAVNKAESPVACATHQDYFIVSSKINEKETLYEVIHKYDFDDILLADDSYTLQGDMWFSVGTYLSGLRSLIDIDKNFTLDLNGHTIKAVTNPRLKNNGSTALFDVTGALTIKGNGKIDVNVPERTVLVANVNSKTATCDVLDGTYNGAPTAFQVTQGTLNIKGGDYSLAAYVEAADPTQVEFLINCIDRYYKDQTAKVNITGGVFHKFNPADNKAEGEHTNFVPATHKVEAAGDVYTVVANA